MGRRTDPAASARVPFVFNCILCVLGRHSFSEWPQQPFSVRSSDSETESDKSIKSTKSGKTETSENSFTLVENKNKRAIKISLKKPELVRNLLARDMDVDISQVASASANGSTSPPIQGPATISTQVVTDRINKGRSLMKERRSRSMPPLFAVRSSSGTRPRIVMQTLDALNVWSLIGPGSARALAN
ncbi:hypothetical protein EVAR_2202_1 [Eumeta japonica]|uniref:Uncharacterized protein n=1 Tax=Eumeta variegata TaxID=151549 RepID=A0A4C1SFA4_EUMVA|nr:hypothetical protein EVAR_2202_1 [Eumeta japonica]